MCGDAVCFCGAFSITAADRKNEIQEINHQRTASIEQRQQQLKEQDELDELKIQEHDRRTLENQKEAAIGRYKMDDAEGSLLQERRRKKLNMQSITTL